MIKKTLYFGNPVKLKKSLNQLKVEYSKENLERTIPIEDIGMVVLDNPQVVITQALLAALIENNAAIISCDSKHLPLGLFMPVATNHVFTEKLRYQLESSEPLRKNLWQQTVKAKIQNQAFVLSRKGVPTKNMEYWCKSVRSGDPDNLEGRAAAYYWKNFTENPAFRRGREESMPNNLLNYGYAILRAIVARSLVASGMLPAVGIHHRNKYNPYCLADDVMEPYRPIVDQLVLAVSEEFEEYELLQLTTDVKRALLVIPTLDVNIDHVSSPLMVAMQRTTSSLIKCFEGVQRKILYPQLG